MIHELLLSSRMKKKIKFPERAENVPVTQKMLYGVRDELKSDMKAMEARLDGKIDSNFHSLSAQVHQLHSQVHRIGILVEEQNAKNNIVLDGLTMLFERQERMEKR